MHLHKIYIYTLIFIIFISGSGCKKSFLDINNDPNRVTESNITPELIFPQAAASVGDLAASGGFSTLDYWLGYWATSGDFAIDQTSTTYNVDFTFQDGLWHQYYHILFNLHQTQVKALAKGDTALAGASLILSVKLWQELVDMFGDIPYSQAFNNVQFTQPKYDKAQSIYNSLLKSLDTAVGFMHVNPSTSFAKVDIVNHGDQLRWEKFANTLRLRLLIRQSEIPGFDPTSELAKITSNGGVLQAGENIMVNPGYTNSQGKQSPFYAVYGFSPTGTEVNTYTRANAYFVNLLTNTKDPRLSRFFRYPGSGGTTIVGTVYGLGSGNPTGAQSSGIGPGLVNNAGQDQWIYPAFESLFLEAEAVARGWLPGDAQSTYQAAVTESFIFLGVPDAVNAASNYMANAPIANWTNAGTTIMSQVRFIAYQKYIALAGIDPLEAYSDLRRLNMIPDKGYISVNPARISSTLPVRFPYPQSEYTTNQTNVLAEGTVNIFTSKIFWQP